MAGRELSERERRELADAHRGEVVIESAEPVEPRRLGQVVSLRLEADTIVALRDIANHRDMTVSDLLREGAAMVIASSGQVRQIRDFSYKVTLIESASSGWNNVEYTTNPNRRDQELSATA